MRIKTSELTGAALNLAVAMALGYLVRKDDKYGVMVLQPANEKGYVAWFSPHELPNYQGDWSQAGPIIDREDIGFFQKKDEGYCQAAQPGAQFVRRGATALIAAMRCFVASKLGDEVEIPDELVPAC